MPDQFRRAMIHWFSNPHIAHISMHTSRRGLPVRKIRHLSSAQIHILAKRQLSIEPNYNLYEKCVEIYVCLYIFCRFADAKMPIVVYMASQIIFGAANSNKFKRMCSITWHLKEYIQISNASTLYDMCAVLRHMCRAMAHGIWHVPHIVMRSWIQKYKSNKSLAMLQWGRRYELWGCFGSRFACDRMGIQGLYIC